MLYNLRISEEWIVSPLARRVYLICAIASIYFITLYLGVTSGIAAAGTSRGEFPAWLAILLRFSFLPGIAGTATLWIAMWYFWFGFDRSSSAKKTLWFLPLLFAPIGPVIYFFVVYRRADFGQYHHADTGVLRSSSGT